MNTLKIINESKHPLFVGGDGAFTVVSSVEIDECGDMHNHVACIYPTSLHYLYYYHDFKFHLILKTYESFSKYKEIIIKNSNIEGEVLVELVAR